MITIVTCTYFSREYRGEERMENCRASMQSWLKLLQYPELVVHVADDGSDPDLWDRFRDYDEGASITYSQQQRRGIGASLNAGLAQAWANGGLALYLQDDLLLESHIDLTFPAKMLETPDIMAVRIGLPHPDTTGRWAYFPDLHRKDSMMMMLEPHHYAMSNRPVLIHQRMVRQYGLYITDTSAQDTEREFNERYCRNPVLRMGQWFPSPWRHQHVVDLGTIQPKGGQ